MRPENGRKSIGSAEYRSLAGDKFGRISSKGRQSIGSPQHRSLAGDTHYTHTHTHTIPFTIRRECTRSTERNGCFSVLPASLIANASDMASWIRWNSNGKPVSDGVIGTRGIVQCLSKNEQTFLCYWWYSILVLVFFKLFYFIGAVPPKSPFYLGVPPKPPFCWGVPPQTPQLYKSTNYHLVNRTIEYRKSLPALRSGVCSFVEKKVQGERK